MIISVVNNHLMKKLLGEKNNNESEFWFTWLNKKLNSYEAF